MLRRLALVPLCLAALPAAATTARIDEARLVGTRLEVRRHDAAAFVTAAAAVDHYELAGGQLVFATTADELGADLYTLDADDGSATAVHPRLVVSGVNHGSFHLDTPRLFYDLGDDGALWRRDSLADDAADAFIEGTYGLVAFAAANDRVVLTNDDFECRYWRPDLAEAALIAGEDGTCLLDTFDGTTVQVVTQAGDDDGDRVVRTFDVALGRYVD